ncbi:hypothetical protein RSP797_23545 [Ralstonia solanacearum]|nr:hypothetical protein RSP797_23545 [Ralstonia solanacearum]
MPAMCTDAGRWRRRARPHARGVPVDRRFSGMPMRIGMPRRLARRSGRRESDNRFLIYQF